MTVLSSRGLRRWTVRAFLLLLLFPISYYRPELRDPQRPVVSPARQRVAEAGCRLAPEGGRLIGPFLPAGPGFGPACDPERFETEIGALSNERDKAGHWAASWFLKGDFSKAIETLEPKSVLRPDDFTLHNDLGAAYLAQAQRLGSAPEMSEKRDFIYLQSLRESSIVLDLSPARVHPETNFNLALALDALGWNGPAVWAWEEASQNETSLPWKMIAERKLGDARLKRKKAGALKRADDHLRLDFKKGLAAEVSVTPSSRSFLRLDLEEAIPFTLKRLAAGAPATEELRALKGLARKVRVENGDALAETILRDAPPAILKADTTERPAWTGALEALRKGRFLLGKRAYSKAEEELAKAVHLLRPLNTPLALSAAVTLQEARIGLQGQRESNRESWEEDSSALGTDLARTGFPGLKARLRFLESLELARSGEFGKALRGYLEAGSIYSRLEEPQNVSLVELNRAETFIFTGLTRTGWPILLASLRQLNSAGDWERFIRGLLVARYAASSGDWRSPARLISEILAREELGPQGRVDALRLAAQALVDSDHFSEAAPLVEEALEELKHIDPESEIRHLSGCDLQSLEATLQAVGAQDAMVLETEKWPNASCFGDDPALEPDQLFRAALAANNQGRAEEAIKLAEESIRRVLGQIRTDSSASTRKGFLENHRVKLDHLLEWLVDLERWDDALGWVLRAFEVEAGSLHGAEAGDALVARLALESNQGLLVFYTTPSQTLGWLVRGNSQRFFFEVPLGRAAAAEKTHHLSQEVAGVLSGRGAESSGLPSLSEISAALLSPIGPRLTGLERLVVLPSAELRSVPFASLFDPLSRSENRYLAQTLELSLAVPAGGRHAASEREPLGPDSTGLVFADPVSSVAISMGLKGLPNAGLEAKEISKLFRASRLLEREAARKESLVPGLAEADFVHIATHTIDSTEGALLLLALRTGELLESGFLKGAEIGALDLHRTSLVNLAACSSAKPGNPAAATEGLVEPFLEAGARTVIATPWPIPDQLSPKIWKPFYAALQRGNSPEAALREAQLEFLQKKSNLANPAYWAGFAVYHGDLPLKGD